MNLSSIPTEKKTNKKLIDEKDKLIEILQKNLQGTPVDHPQTEEIIAIQAKKEQLSNEVLELKVKLFQSNKLNEDLTREKEVLISQKVNNEPLAISQPVDTANLADYMSRVSFKEKEISQLIQEKNKLVQEKNQLSQEKSQLAQDKSQLDKSNKEKLEKINRLKDRLMGKELLKSTHHSLWELITVEVSKFWKYLKRM